MKKLICISVVFILALCTSCKKGEDDPFFTFASRKARLAGEWKMTSGSITIGIKDSVGTSKSQVYKMTATNYEYDIVGKGAHFEEKCMLQITFTKKGEVTIMQEMDSLRLDSRGTWDFLGRTGDNKNKESINIQLNTISGKSGWYRLFNKAFTNFNYKIRELRNKKLVLYCEEEMVELTTGIGVYISSEYEFAQ